MFQDIRDVVKHAGPMTPSFLTSPGLDDERAAGRAIRDHPVLRARVKGGHGARFDERCTAYVHGFER